MKKISTIFVAVLFMLFLAPFSLQAQEFSAVPFSAQAQEFQDPFKATASDVVVEISEVKAIPIDVDSLSQYPGYQLGYDLTQCDRNPFDMPSLHTVICNCTYANVYVDTRNAPGVVTVIPGWAFNFGSGWDLYQGSAFNLDPGLLWVIYASYTFHGNGQGLYAAGVIYRGRQYVNYRNYPVYVNNCP